MQVVEPLGLGPALIMCTECSYGLEAQRAQYGKSVDGEVELPDFRVFSNFNSSDCEPIFPKFQAFQTYFIKYNPEAPSNM